MPAGQLNPEEGTHSNHNRKETALSVQPSAKAITNKTEEIIYQSINFSSNLPKLFLFILLIFEIYKQLISLQNIHTANQATKNNEDQYTIFLSIVSSLLIIFFRSERHLIKPKKNTGENNQTLHSIECLAFCLAKPIFFLSETIRLLNYPLNNYGLTKLVELHKSTLKQLSAIYSTLQKLILLYFFYTMSIAMLRKVLLPNLGLPPNLNKLRPELDSLVYKLVSKLLIAAAKLTTKRPQIEKDILPLAIQITNMQAKSYNRLSECDRLAKLISRANPKKLRDSLLQNHNMSIVFQLAKDAFVLGHAELLVVIINVIGDGYFDKNSKLILPPHIKKIVGKNRKLFTATLSPMWQLQNMIKKEKMDQTNGSETICLLNQMHGKDHKQQIEIVTTAVRNHPQILDTRFVDSITYYKPILMCLIIMNITDEESDINHQIYHKTSDNALTYALISWPMLLGFLLNIPQPLDATQPSASRSLGHLTKIIFELNQYDLQQVICSNPGVIYSLLSHALDTNKHNCLRLIARVLEHMPETPAYVTMFKNELSEKTDLTELLTNIKFGSYRKPYGMLGCLELDFAKQLISDQAIHTNNKLLLQEYVNEREKEVAVVDTRRTKKAETAPSRNPPKETELQDIMAAAEATAKKSCHEFINHTSTVLANLEKKLQKPNTSCFRKLKLDLETTINEIEQNPDLLAKKQVKLKHILKTEFLSLWHNHNCSEKIKEAPAGINITTLKKIKNKIENFADYIPAAPTTAAGSNLFTGSKSTQEATHSPETPQPIR